jgi:hypothetical protein
MEPPFYFASYQLKIDHGLKADLELICSNCNKFSLSVWESICFFFLGGFMEIV